MTEKISKVVVSYNPSVINPTDEEQLSEVFSATSEFYDDELIDVLVLKPAVVTGEALIIQPKNALVGLIDSSERYHLEEALLQAKVI